jgi:hypothetical protein
MILVPLFRLQSLKSCCVPLRNFKREHERNDPVETVNGIWVDLAEFDGLC